MYFYFSVLQLFSELNNSVLSSFVNSDLLSENYQEIIFI